MENHHAINSSENPPYMAIFNSYVKLLEGLTHGRRWYKHRYKALEVGNTPPLTAMAMTLVT